MAESGAGRVRLQHFNVMLSLTHYMPVRKLQSVVKMFALNHKVGEWCVESSSFLTWVTQTIELTLLAPDSSMRSCDQTCETRFDSHSCFLRVYSTRASWSLANSTSPTRVAVWSKSDWQSRVDLTQHIVSAVSLWRGAPIDHCIKLIHSLIFAEYIIVIIIIGHN